MLTEQLDSIWIIQPNVTQIFKAAVELTFTLFTIKIMLYEDRISIPVTHRVVTHLDKDLQNVCETL